MHFKGLYLRFSGSPLEVSRRIQSLCRHLLSEPLPAITDIIPAYGTVYLEYDASRLSEEALRAWLRGRLEADDTPLPERLVEIPVHYDGEDIAEVAAQTGLTPEEVAARHAAPEYRVVALGFTPGFPFMAEVDPLLRIPRRGSPRPRVPAHSVAMANHQTGVYPVSSPGGWHLLGRTLTRLYDPQRPEPFLLEPSDRVRFVPSEGEVPPEIKPLELLPDTPQYPLLKVIKAGVLELVVDRGRFLSGRYGLARSGALDARAAALANRLVGNPMDAALLELNLCGGLYEALAEGVLAFAGYGMELLLDGVRLEPFRSFSVKRGNILSFKMLPQGCRAYLAFAGGLESRRFRGSASVDLRGGIGRPLRAGDLLGVTQVRRARSGFAFVPYRPLPEVMTLRIYPGSQADRGILEALTKSPFRVSMADRMGIRLEGARFPALEITSEGTPIGAVQVTSSGEPIILLHDRGTLGGYAKPAIIYPEDLPKVAQLRPGSSLRFVLLEDAQRVGILEL